MNFEFEYQNIVFPRIKEKFFFLGDSRHGLYNGGGAVSAGKKELYEGGHVAQCTKAQAIGITVFVLTAIFLTSLAVAFVRPFNGESLSMLSIFSLFQGRCKGRDKGL